MSSDLSGIKPLRIEIISSVSLLIFHEVHMMTARLYGILHVFFYLKD
jgi:hypothetical protein